MPIESLRDKALLIYGVYDPVCIVLHARCEDHNLVEVLQLIQEFMNTRSHEVIVLSLKDYEENCLRHRNE